MSNQITACEVGVSYMNSVFVRSLAIVLSKSKEQLIRERDEKAELRVLSEKTEEKAAA
jgi:hypothetical protein